MAEWKPVSKHTPPKTEADREESKKILRLNDLAELLIVIVAIIATLGPVILVAILTVLTTGILFG